VWVLSTEVSQGYCDWVFSITHLLGSGRNPGGKSLSHSTSGLIAVPAARVWAESSALTVCMVQPTLLLLPVDEAAPVMTIAPDQLAPGKRLFQRREQGSSSLLVGPIGDEHFDGQQMALGVNQGVPFAPPDFFSPYRSPFQGHEPRWF
jgi:hypothetical protein